MKIIVVGGKGTLGRAIVDLLSERHEVVVASRRTADIEVDITSADSIREMYESVGHFDALINAAGEVPFKSLADISTLDYREAIDNKLLSQINLVLIGMDYINDAGSFTLTSGVLSHEPVVLCSAAATANAGINGFVRSAAIDMPRGTRLNVVSPTLLTESVDAYADYFPGFIPIPAATAALFYLRSVEGKLNGKVFQAVP